MISSISNFNLNFFNFNFCLRFKCQCHTQTSHFNYILQISTSIFIASLTSNALYSSIFIFKLLNQRFFVFNFQLQILISDFYYKYLTSNPISISIALRFLQSQNSSTSSVFNLRFLQPGNFHLQISISYFNFKFKFLQFQTQSLMSHLNFTLQLHS